MSDQTDKSKPRISDKDVLPEEAKDTKKTQSEEGFGWSIEAEGADSNPALPQAEQGGGSQDRDPPPVPGPTSISDHGQQETSAPPQGPLSPPDQEAPSASHGLAGATETGPAPVADISANAAPRPDVEPFSSASPAGAATRVPAGTHTPPLSPAGSAPSPDSGNTPPPPIGATPTPVGSHTPPNPTGVTPTPGAGHTPPTSTGGTPPTSGTQTPPTSTGTTPTPGGGHTPPTTTAARISGLDTDTAREDHHVVGGKLSAGGLLTVSDPDAGEDEFQAVTGAPGSAGYGSFTVAENGRWTYSADNSQTVIQALRPGSSLVDRITVHSADGTAHELRVVITGTNDTPVLSASTASATEDGSSVSGQMSATDVDAGDTKAFSIGQPVDGFTMHADGAWSFDPSHTAYQHLAAGQTQQVTIPVTVTDSAGATDIENLVITVTGTNDAPVVSGPVDLGSGTEDKSVPISTAQLLGHATDIDTGDQLSVSNLAASHGTITGDAAHGFIFTPDPNYNGPVTLSYQVTDGHGGHVPQTASLTLGATPDAAVITGTDTGSATEDNVSSSNRLVVSGSLNVSDPDGPSQEHFQYSSFGEHAVSDPFGGNLHIDRAGNWGYEVDNTHPAIQALAAGQEGHAIYEVHSADGTAHRIQITIRGTNDAPILSAATASATEDGKAVFGQMSATDVDTGDTKSFSLAQSVDGFTMNADGSWSFDPSHAAYQHLAAGQTQQVTIPVTVTDSAGATDTENLVITVTGTGDAAVVGGVDTGSVTEWTAGQNMSPDYAQPGMATLSKATLDARGHLSITDPDAGEASFDTHGLGFTYHGTYGDLLLRANGEWFYHADAGSNRFVGGAATTRGTTIDRLGGGQSLTDAITVYSKDGTAHDIVITIHGSNDRPYCSSEVQLASGTEDVAQPLTLKQLLSNTVDVDANDAGKLAITGLKVDHGSVRDNQDGTFTFTPEKDYNGQVHFTYDVKDAHGGLTHTGATTTLAAAKDAAVITDANIPSVTEDRGYINTHNELQVDGHLDITDPDAGEALFDPNIGPQTAHGIGYDTQLGGRILLMRDGDFTYYIDNRLPMIQQLGTGETAKDTVTIRSVDGTTHQIEFTIHGTNDAPVLTASTASATEDGSAVTGQMSATDIDHGDTKSFSLARAVDGFSMKPDGSWSFDPSHTAYQHLADGQTQQVTIPVTVTDRAGATDTEDLVITVTGTDDAAVIGGVDTGSVTEGTAGQDKSPDHAQPGIFLLGTATLDASGQLTISDPDAGEASFDTHGLGFTYHGTYGDLHLRANGEWFYSADAGSSRFFDGRPTSRGTAIDQLGEGQSLTDTITVYSKDGTAHDIVITIHGSNDRPYCSSEVQLANGTEDVAQTLTLKQLLANTVDVDANDAGKLAIAGLKVDHGSVRDNQDGTFTFTPEKDYNGQVHFTYDVKDVHGGLTHTGATTTLAAVRDAAVITGIDTGGVTEDRNVGSSSAHPLAVSGSLSVHDPDGTAWDHFQYNRFGEHAISDPFGGSLHIDRSGNWGYEVDNTHPTIQALAAGQEGHAIYEVHSADGTAHRIQITIHGTNDAPVLSAATASVTEDGSSVTGQMSATDVDTGDTKAFSISQPVDGFTMNADGSWSFDPSHAAYQHLATGQIETLTIPVTVTDNAGATDAQNLVITVTGTNDGPAVTGPVALGSGTEDKAVAITAAQLLTHATDIDTGDTLSVTGLSASHGTITGDAAQGFTFTPDPNYNGPVTLSYQVTDGHGGQVAQTAKIVVAPRDDAAVVTGTDTGDLTEDRHVGPSSAHPIWVGGTLTVTDPDGPAWNHFNASIWGEHAISDPFGGSLHLTRSGNWDYSVDNSHAAVQSLAAGQEGHAVYRVSTADGTFHQIKITIHGTNDAPVLTAATASATEDGSVVSGQMSATDVDTGDAQAYSLGGTAPAGFSLNADGSWSFDPTDAAYQHLAQGATQQLTIPITVTDKAGATDTENLVITVTGTNDKAVYTGSSTSSVTEDRLSGSGKLETPWNNVDVTDADSGEGRVVAIEVGGVLHQLPANFASTIPATYGSFHTTHGSDGHDKWMYFADNNNPTIQGLKTGEHLNETAVLVTADGTRVPISVTLQGHEDGAIIDTPGSTAGWLGEAVEDQQTQISGQLQAHDADTHDSVSFTPRTTTNAYGAFTVDASGHWSFALNNSAVQFMAAGQRQAMGFDIEALSTDGSKVTQHVEIFARGTNDAPVLSASTTSATEDGQSVSGQMSATDIDTGDSKAFSIAQAVDGFSINADGSWSFDPTDAAYQHLAAGQAQQVIIPVTVTDKAGLSDTQNLVITVTGTNDAAHITGPDSATLVEDRNLSGGFLTAGGSLQVTDTDSGQDSFTPVTGLLGTGGYGSFSVDAQGHWSYTADNSQHAIQQLGHGQSLTDTCVVTSSDGTRHTLNVTIQGTDEAPVVKPSVTAVQGVGTQHLAGTLASGGLGGWAIDNGHGGAVQSFHGQYGTLTINPQTGHFEYHYQQNSGVIKHGGSSATSGQHVDTFHITQHGAAAGDVDVHVQISVQSVHGNSGHHVDHTVLQGITFTQAPTVQHDAPDDAWTDEVTVTLTADDGVVLHEQSQELTEHLSATVAHDQSDAGSIGSDMERPGETDRGPINSGHDHLAAYFDAIGHDPAAAAPSSTPAEHLTVYLDAIGAVPDQTGILQDLPDPAVLALDDQHAVTGNDAQDTPEDNPDGGQITEVPDPVVQDPNDDTSHFGS